MLIPYSFGAALETNPHVRVIQPVALLLNEGGEVDLGVVGPGQTIEIEIDRGSNIFDFNGAEEIWDKLIIDDASLPQSWFSDPSKHYEGNPKAFVDVDQNAQDGIYTFELYTARDYQTASKNPVHFRARVRVTREVFDLTVKSKLVSGGVGQPARFVLLLENKGSANDAFNIEVIEGSLPGKWTYEKQVYVPHNNRREVIYEVVAGEPVERDVGFKATSLSSYTIADSDTGRLQASSSLIQDMRSVSNGIILFPSIEQAVYYLMGFVASNFISG